MPTKRPCPCLETRVSRARVACTRAHARDYLLQGPWFTLPSSGQATLWVGSQGGQGQEFLGARECLAHIATSRSPETKESFLEAVHQQPQGRSCSLKRTLSESLLGSFLSSYNYIREGGYNFRSLDEVVNRWRVLPRLVLVILMHIRKLF